MDMQEIDIGALRERLREYKPIDNEGLTPAVRLSSEFRDEIQQLRSDGIAWSKIAQLLGGVVLPKTLAAAFERQENKRKQIERKRKAAERTASAAAKPSKALAPLALRPRPVEGAATLPLGIPGMVPQVSDNDL
jgi:hypothetical protein